MSAPLRMSGMAGIILRSTLFFFFLATQALAAEYHTEVELPIRATIVNLAQMPLKDAIAFCDIHNMDCPHLREQATVVYPLPEVYEAENWVYVREGSGVQWIGE